jgi:hypothetical protein
MPSSARRTVPARLRTARPLLGLLLVAALLQTAASPLLARADGATPTLRRPPV